MGNGQLTYSIVARTEPGVRNREKTSTRWSGFTRGILFLEVVAALQVLSPSALALPTTERLLMHDSGYGIREPSRLRFSARISEAITNALRPGESIHEIILFPEYTVAITSACLLIVYNQDVDADGSCRACTRDARRGIEITPHLNRIRMDDVMSNLETYYVSGYNHTIYFLERSRAGYSLFTVFPIDGVDGSELPRTYSIEADVRGAKIHVNQPKIGGREIVVVLRSGEEVIIPDEGQ